MKIAEQSRDLQKVSSSCYFTKNNKFLFRRFPLTSVRQKAPRRVPEVNLLRCFYKKLFELADKVIMTAEGKFEFFFEDCVTQFNDFLLGQSLCLNVMLYFFYNPKTERFRNAFTI